MDLEALNLVTTWVNFLSSQRSAPLFDQSSPVSRWKSRKSCALMHTPVLRSGEKSSSAFLES